MFSAVGVNGINLQATLSAATAMGGYTLAPHHPITCSGDLELHEDGSLECPHVRTAPGDARTEDAVTATIAIMLFELAHERFGSTPRVNS